MLNREEVGTETKREAKKEKENGSKAKIGSVGEQGGGRTRARKTERGRWESKPFI